jgi:hypothetical protein
VVTIYEVVEENGQSFAIPQFQFGWPTITDPHGTVRNYIAYPGTCVPHDIHGCSEEFTPGSTVTDMGWDGRRKGLLNTMTISFQLESLSTITLGAWDCHLLHTTLSIRFHPW